MKTFKQHIKEDGKMVGTATSNAVEDGSVGAHNIHKPEILNKVNALLALLLMENTLNLKQLLIN